MVYRVLALSSTAQLSGKSNESLAGSVCRRVVFFHLFLRYYRGDVLERLSFNQVDQFHSHCITAGLPNFAHADADHLTASGDEHYFIRIVDRKGPDHIPGSIARLHRDDALAAARLSSIGIKPCSLPDSV